MPRASLASSPFPALLGGTQAVDRRAAEHVFGVEQRLCAPVMLSTNAETTPETETGVRLTGPEAFNIYRLVVCTLRASLV